ncbi:MAG: cadherin-like domain-containing protein [Chthoniobacter sp.]|nr:cadherin-like domain-containing protein [Chthoniobacter sp.]
MQLYWYIPSRQAAMIIPQELLFPVTAVSLTSPRDGARFGLRAGQPTTVTLTADTSDVLGKATKVSFFNGDTLIGSTATAPYSFAWTNVAAGDYRITARAAYSTGQVSTSPVAAISVDSYTVPITEGLACHFDASVGITTDANGAVKTWQDRSGNGHHATLDTSVWNSGTATVATNQMMSLPAVQIRGGWFDLAGAFFPKEQYVVVRSPNATWNKPGAFIGRKSYDSLSVRASSYTVKREGTGFWDMPAACSKNGVSTMELKPITDYMIVKITVDDRASAANLAKYPYCQIGRTEKEAGMDWDVAEIIGYSKSLSPGDEALVGGYLAAKYGITTSYPAAGSLANKATTATTTTSATLNATLMCNGNNYDVVAFWGPVNGGMNPASWANTARISAPSKAASIDLERKLTNLTPGSTYYSTFRATNATQTIWAAAPQSFATTSTAKDFLTFGANVSGSSAIIDTATGKVAWTVPYGTDLTSLAAAYTVSAQAAGSPASGTKRNFSTAQTYTLTAQDGSTKVYTVTASRDPITPSSINAALTTLEDKATALTASNFGYADPKSVALAEVQITSLPAKGTLKLKGSPVSTVPLTVAAAEIGNLTYQSALNGNGTPYTIMGIKVKNANNLWSRANAVMTVNVTHVNHAPTSAAASLVLKSDAVKTFAAVDFPFADVDSGDRLGAIKVTLLPAHGILKLGGTTLTPGAAIQVANIETLTYTPIGNYAGADSFKFQVGDGTAFSTDATLTITVKSASIIEVANGSFETPGNGLGGPWARFGSPWPSTGLPGNYQQIQAVTGGSFTSVPDGNWIALISTDDVPSTAPIAQNLGESVAVGDTVSVTFSLGRSKGATGGKGVAYFKVDTALYPMEFDTTSLSENSWKSYTMTKTLTNAGDLSIGFFGTTKANSWLDKISNVTVTPGVAGKGRKP